MSQIITRSVTANSIDDTLIRLRNAQPLRARNAANSGDVSVLDVDSSNIVQLLSQTQIATSPTAANDLVNKSYVDLLIQGIKWKDPVRALASTNITLSGTQTIDGVSVIAGDRVGVIGQTTGSSNGIYVVASGAWSRSTDADASSEVLAMVFEVSEGTTFGSTVYLMNTIAPITLGTTSLSFIPFPGAGSIAAGNGLQKIGSTLSVKLADNSITASGAGVAVVNDPSGAIVTGASGIKVQVASATTKINGSNQIEGLKDQKDSFTLSGTDITNQFVLSSQLSVSNSMDVMFSGVLQVEGVDYTLSPSGGVTKVTFAGDLATGGNSALVSGDKLYIKYRYL